MNTGARLRGRIEQLGNELAALTRWWVHEVREAWHDFLERIAPLRARRYLIRLHGGGGSVTRIGTQQETEAREFSFSESGELPALQQFWQEQAPGHARAFVVLPAASVLMCELQLPPIRAAQLRDAVALRMERELPLPAEQVCMDWKPVPRGNEGAQALSVAIARRAEVQRVRDAVHSWGWTVVGVGLWSDSGRPAFDLLPRQQLFEFALGVRERRLLAVAAGLCVLWCAVTLGQWGFERSKLAAPLAQARVETEQIRTRKAALQKLSAPLLELNKAMQEASVTEVLAALSAAVPSDTWVYQFDARSAGTDKSSTGEVKLEAYTVAATSLIEQLQASRRFTQVRLLESTASGLESGGDRVKLTAQLAAVGAQ